MTTGNYTEIDIFATNLKQLSYGLEIGTNIGERVDFFEPRTEGRFWKRNGQFSTEGYFSTDISVNIPGGENGAWVTPYILDPVNNQTIYVGYEDNNEVDENGP